MEEVGRHVVARVKQRLSSAYEPNPWIYWSDLLASASIGWLAFAGVIYAESFVLEVVCVVVAIFAMYRALVFTHELDHIPAGSLPGFRAAYHLLCGMPFSLPHFLYHGVHRIHHSARYGTHDDPEYIPYGKSGSLREPLLLLATGCLLPLTLLLRSLVLVPLGLALPRLRAWVDTKASSFVLKSDFVRELPAGAELRAWRLEEYSTSVFAWFAVIAIASGYLPGITLLIWAIVLIGAMSVNLVRALATAHKYTSEGRQLAFEEQIADSVNLDKFSVLNVLIAPVGLGYHAAHHALPGLPYHELGRAHRMLRQECQNGGHPLAFYEATRGSTTLRAISNQIRRTLSSHPPPPGDGSQGAPPATPTLPEV